MSDKWKVPAQVRLSLWLGLEKEQGDWIGREDEGLPTVVAETVRFYLMFGCDCQLSGTQLTHVFAIKLDLNLFLRLESIQCGVKRCRIS